MQLLSLNPAGARRCPPAGLPGAGNYDELPSNSLLPLNPAGALQLQTHPSFTLNPAGARLQDCLALAAIFSATDSVATLQVTAPITASSVLLPTGQQRSHLLGKGLGAMCRQSWEHGLLVLLVVLGRFFAPLWQHENC